MIPESYAILPLFIKGNRVIECTRRLIPLECLSRKVNPQLNWILEGMVILYLDTPYLDQILKRVATEVLLDLQSETLVSQAVHGKLVPSRW
jgi:hypothetical protein